MDNNTIAKIEEILDYKFNNPDLLITALCHDSYSVLHEGYTSYQVLEFLGDGIVGFIIDDTLTLLHPNYKVGDLTGVKKTIVSTKPLSKTIKQLQLDKYILVAKNTIVTEKICEDVYESLVGAIYRDSSIDEAKRFVLRTLKPLIETQTKENSIDYKSTLMQKYVRSRCDFRTVNVTGPAHKPMFTIGLYIDNVKVAQAEASSKAKAQEECCRIFLTKEE
ncbi:MAG: putative dsRNA-binding protein [Christensenella sp.]|nr:putative dsRNA-binding protein [Christensenella sp.]